MNLIRRLGMISLVFFCVCPNSWAAMESFKSKVTSASSKKTGAYVSDGIITGGDESIDDVIVLQMRHSVGDPSRGFERIVIDLDGNVRGEPASIKKPSFYQVSVNKDLLRVEISITGKPKIAFDLAKATQAFKLSHLIKNAMLLEKVDPDRWTFALEFKSQPQVEVFELGSPVRIILDVRPDPLALSSVGAKR